MILQNLVYKIYTNSDSKKHEGNLLTLTTKYMQVLILNEWKQSFDTDYN